MVTIQNEFGLGLNLNAYRGTAYYISASPYSLLSRPASPNAIAMSSFYGTQVYRPTMQIDYVVVGGGGGGGLGIYDPYGGGAGGGGGGAINTGSAFIAFNASNTVTIGDGGLSGDSIYAGVDGKGDPVYTDRQAASGNGSQLYVGVSGNTYNAPGGYPGYNTNNGYRGGASGGIQNLGGEYNSAGGSNGIGGGGGGGGVDDANSSAPGGAGGVWNGFRFAGGGGGGSDYSVGGTGGLGGGGKGGSNVNGLSGTVNTGGGGGGGGSSGNRTAGGYGGSGIVMIRYAGSSVRVNGGTTQIMGGYVYHTFTASGTFTAVI
jgi:hypothetical protein